MDKIHYNAKQAAALLGCSSARVRQLMKDKILKGYMDAGSWHIDPVSVHKRKDNPVKRGPKPEDKSVKDFKKFLKEHE